MPFIVNDLSIYNGFDTCDDFVKELISLVKELSSNPSLSDNFFISNSFSTLKIDENFYVYSKIYSIQDQTLRLSLRLWLDKSRLFWNDCRTYNDNDYFEYNGINVTEQGLGECSRRALIGNTVTSFSFGKKFCTAILKIQQGLSEDILQWIDVNNIWHIDPSKSARARPKSWTDVISFVQQDYPSLNLSERLLDQISVQPFNIGICDRFFELCKALDEIISSRTPEGDFTTLTHELISKYCHGDKAWFSDESDGDKRNFENELKFYPPSMSTKKTYTFHGKIKIEQIRIYIEWPLKPEQKSIDIVYFGPKITKK